MTERVRYLIACAAVVLGYLWRPVSCGQVLAREPRPADNPYASIDPHGFGVLGAVIAALVLLLPVMWLLLRTRPAGATQRPPLRIVAVLLAIATPMVLQTTYAHLAIAYAWPVYAASVAWFAIVATLCWVSTPGLPSAHGAFDRNPRAAWSVVGVIAVFKLGFLFPALGVPI